MVSCKKERFTGITAIPSFMHGVNTSIVVLTPAIAGSFTAYPLEDAVIVSSFTEYPLEDAVIMSSFTAYRGKDATTFTFKLLLLATHVTLR